MFDYNCFSVCKFSRVSKLQYSMFKPQPDNKLPEGQQKQILLRSLILSFFFGIGLVCLGALGPLLVKLRIYSTLFSGIMVLGMIQTTGDQTWLCLV